MKKPKNISRKNDNLNHLFAELKTEYMESFPAKLKAIEKLWQEKNRRAIEDEFHKMKGTGTTYGVEDVSNLAEVMEALCYQGHEKLGFGVLLAMEILNKICAKHTKNIPYDLSRDKLFKALRQMHDELESA
jgi:HPt (histidine-containing phosphotransfer) domain-containing protein